MNRKLGFRVALAALIGLIAATWQLLAPATHIATTANKPSSANADVQPDSTDARALFDYLLSQQAVPTPGALQPERALILNDKGLVNEQDKALMAKYLSYKQALFSPEAPVLTGTLDLAYLTQLDAWVRALQQQFFNVDEIATLFEEENMLRELAIAKLRLQLNSDDATLAQERWQALLDNYPEEVGQAFRNAALLGQLNDGEALDTGALYQQRLMLVGPEATQRLEALDERREKFRQRVDSYLAQREAILADMTQDNSTKGDSILALRERMFEAGEWRRVEALERLREQRK